jgi:ankyrin repeat protein
MDFLECEAKVEVSSQALMAVKEHSWHLDYSQEFPRQMTGLHLAAYFGLKEAMITLLKGGYDLDSKESDGWTPLSWATWNGHEAVVELLLEKGGKKPQ